MNHEPKNKVDAWKNGFYWGIPIGIIIGFVIRYGLQ